MAILGIDVGGTLTDAVLLEDGLLRIAKVPTAARQESVLAAARVVGASAAPPPPDPGTPGGGGWGSAVSERDI